MAILKLASLALAAALLPSALAGSQVNFYYDANCVEYGGSARVGLGQVVGASFAAQSMLFVDYGDQNYGGADRCIGTCGPTQYFCKDANCDAYDVSPALGKCKHFANGVWAAEACGCPGCKNECSGRPF